MYPVNYNMQDLALSLPNAGPTGLSNTAQLGANPSLTARAPPAMACGAVLLPKLCHRGSAARKLAALFKT